MNMHAKSFKVLKGHIVSRLFTDTTLASDHSGELKCDMFKLSVCWDLKMGLS